MPLPSSIQSAGFNICLQYCFLRLPVWQIRLTAPFMALQVLSRLPAEFHDKRSIAWWLAQQRPETLLSAFKVMSHIICTSTIVTSFPDEQPASY